MAIDLGATALVNAGGALLFFVGGLLILLVSKGRRRPLLLGGLATLFGLFFVVQNIFYPVGGGSLPPAGLTALVAASLALLALAAAHDVARDAAPRDRRRLLWFTVVTLAALTLLAVLVILGLSDLSHAMLQIGFQSTPGTLMVLVVAAAMAFRNAKTQSQRMGFACLGIAFGLYAIYQSILLGVYGAPSAAGDSLGVRLYEGTNLALAVLSVAAAFAFVSPPAAPRMGRAVFLSLLAAGSLGLLSLLVPAGSEGPGFGIMRTVGVASLTLAVVKYGLLDVPLPRVVVKRGVLAGAALAILFIVAQVAQNFFSAQYGLLGGGVIAGTFLFAASPVQHAFERRQTGDPGPRGGENRAEASYRKAVEWALRDGKLNRDEEGHLHELAHNLGITGVRAHAILVDAERGTK